jgi:flavin reductase (DIM6/NTAB) family NADH-FMN oxidoreductase RutF
MVNEEGKDSLNPGLGPQVSLFFETAPERQRTGFRPGGSAMDDDSKKTALRMIPYGLYVMTAENDGEVAAATVNWVTQTSFSPPLVAVGVKTDSGAYGLSRAAGHFALNILGKGQQGAARGSLCVLQTGPARRQYHQRRALS